VLEFFIVYIGTMRAKVLVLSMCMLITGSINTIATKYQVC
jgi:hypothetical protein